MLPHSSFSNQIRKAKAKLRYIVASKQNCEEASRDVENMAACSLIEQSNNLKERHMMCEVAFVANLGFRDYVLSALQRVKQLFKKLYDYCELSYGNYEIELERITELENAIADLRNHIAQRENKCDLEKQSVLQSCQQAIDEQFKCQFNKLKQELSSTLSKLDYRQFLQARTSDDNSLRQIQLQKNCIARFEQELGKITDRLRTEKKEWEAFLQGEMDKEQAEFKNSLRQTVESEFKEDSQRNIEIMVSQAKLSYLEERKLARQAKIGNILTDAKKQWNKEHERDIPQLTRKRKLSES